MAGNEHSVGMGPFFYPCGGSARVAGYLSRALGQVDWPVKLACGSLGARGALGNAESVFSGVDIVTASYDDAVARWARGEAAAGHARLLVMSCALNAQRRTPADEAEWSLRILESMLDFYFVRPAKAKARRDSLNAKLAEAGKPLLKVPPAAPSGTSAN